LLESDLLDCAPSVLFLFRAADTMQAASNNIAAYGRSWTVRGKLINQSFCSAGRYPVSVEWQTKQPPIIAPLTFSFISNFQGEQQAWGPKPPGLRSTCQ